MTEEKLKPAYYGIMPASVRYDKSLHPNAKIIYTEISSLCNKEGYCWASNSYFAELFDVTTRSVINWINNLREKKYIKTELIFKNGSKEIKERRIYISDPVLTKTLQNKGLGSDEINFTTPGENQNTNPSEENFMTGSEINFISPSEENFQPSEENFTHNNKPLSKKGLYIPKPAKAEKKIPSEEDVLKLIEINNLHPIKNTKTFLDYYFPGGRPKLQGKTILQKLMTWCDNPKNQVEKKPTGNKNLQVEESPELKKIRSDIKFFVGNDAQLFDFYSLEKGSEGWKIKANKAALKYQEVLEKINIKIEVK